MENASDLAAVGGWHADEVGDPSCVGHAFGQVSRVWNQPYLETCCRSALHRLHLCGRAGRPAGLLDDPCLQRLSGMGLSCRRVDGRFELTADGSRRHSSDVLGLRAVDTGSSEADRETARAMQRYPSPLR